MAALKLKNVTVFFWTDSTTVLQWLRSSPSRWKTFVANRVSQIQLATMHCTWRHVPGVDNPADYIPLGLRPIDLLNCLCWWYGPPWLILSPDDWPKFTVAAEDSLEVSVEGRKVQLVAMTVAKTSFSDHLFSLFSSYPKLRRATAFGKRYVGRLQARALLRRTDPDNYKPLEICKNPAYMTQPLTTEELQATELFLYRTAQEEAFAEEISDLCGGERVDKSSKLKWLHPFIVQNCILRVGGRLRNAELDPYAKHPIVLSAKHPLTALLTSHFHVKLLHAGPSLLLATPWPFSCASQRRQCTSSW